MFGIGLGNWTMGCDAEIKKFKLESKYNKIVILIIHTIPVRNTNKLQYVIHRLCSKLN